MSKLSDETREARLARSWSPWGEINRVLRRHGVKPTRTAKECEELHDRRVLARLTRPTETPNQVLERRYRDAIGRHGGPTVIEKYGDGRMHYSPLHVIDRDVARNLTLLRAEEYVHMGTPTWIVAYLCGRDSGRWWCKRVASTCTTVQGAWEWMVPVAVRRALAEGVEVLRQGDLWAVRSGRDSAFPEYRVICNDEMAYPWGCDYHEWDAAARVARFVIPFRRREDRRLPELHVPWPAKWFRSRTVEG